MRKKITQYLLLAVMLLTSTVGMAQKSALIEDFDGNSLPVGWSQSGKIWTFADGVATFKTTAENATDTLMTPMLDLKSLDHKPVIILGYSQTAYNTLVDTLIVLARIDEKLPWQVYTTLATAETKKEITVELPTVGLSQLQIAFVGKSVPANGIALDYLYVQNKVECATAPTGIKAENLSSTGCVLMWTVSDAETFVGYNLRVATNKLEPNSEVGDVANVDYSQLNDEFYDLLGKLSANTTYYVYVQSVCKDDDVSPWTEFVFSTPCVPKTIPFTDGFENATLDGCYHAEIGGNSSSVSIRDNLAYSGRQSLYFYTYTANSTYFYLPEIDTDLTKCQVRFMAASSMGGNYTKSVEVGIAEDYSPSSYVALTTINLPSLNRWEEVIVSLAGYTGTGKYVVLRTGNGDKPNYIWIDDLTVEPAAECSKPMFVTVSNVNSSRATIDFTPSGAENSWEIIVSENPVNNFTSPNLGATGFRVLTSEHPYTTDTLSNKLSPLTDYFVYVRPACSTDLWTVQQHFKTTTTVTYPYVEHFDRLDPTVYTDNINAVPTNWVTGQRYVSSGADRVPGTITTGNTSYLMTTFNYEETAYIPAALKVVGTSTYCSFAITPEMPVASLKGKMLSFWMRSSSATVGIRVGVMKSQDTELPEDQMIKNPENFFAIDTIFCSATNTWEKKKILFDKYEGDGKFICFMAMNGSITAYVDDIELNEAPSCFTTENLSFNILSATSATATWTEKSPKTAAWRLKLSSSEINPSTENGDVFNGTVTEKQYEAKGLKPATTYYIYVHPDCDDEDVEWVSASATTYYAIGTLPYENTFVATGDKKVGANKDRGPEYWTVGNINVTAALGTQTNIPYLYNTATAGMETPFLYFNNTSSATSAGEYAVMPEMAAADIKDLTLSFIGFYNAAEPSQIANYAAVKNTYYGVLKIGVVESPTDINKTDKFTKVTPIATIYGPSAIKTPKNYVVNMESYTGTGKYIVFYSDTVKSNYFALDNLVINLTKAPQQVTNVQVVDSLSTTSSLTFNWKENGMAENWNIRVFSEAVEDVDAATPAWSGTATTTSATATGLKPSSKYYVYVQSVQGEQTGSWSPVASAWTECAPFALPFYEDFNSYGYQSSYSSPRVLSPCYTLYTDYNSNMPYIKHGQATTSTTTKTGTGTTYYYVDHTYGNTAGTGVLYMTGNKNHEARLVFPELAETKNLQLRFYMAYSTAFTTTSSCGLLEVGVWKNDTFTHKAWCKLTKAKEWEEFNVEFDELDGQICFRIANNDDTKAELGITYASGVYYAYIDDVSITAIPQCKRVDDLLASDIDSVSAVLSWSKVLDETGYKIKVSTTDINPATDAADVLTTQVTDLTKLYIALNGLQANTNYYAYIQTVNSVKDCAGEWNSLSFRTLCKGLDFPYYEDFETYEANSTPDCFMQTGDDQTFATTTAVGTYPNAVDAGSKMTLKITQSSVGKDNYLVLPLINVSSVNDLQLKIFIEQQNTGYEYYTVGVITDPADKSTFVPIKSDSILYASGTRQWYEKVYTFEDYKTDSYGKKGKYIAIRTDGRKSTSATGSYANTFYLDNITISYVDKCPNPSGLMATVNATDDHAIDFSWSANAKNGTYQVNVYKTEPADINAATPVATKTVTDTTALTISGLEGNTIYYGYVRMTCGTDGNSDWSFVAHARTGCDSKQTLPYVEGFENYDTSLPQCWFASSASVSNPGGGGTSTYTPQIYTNNSTYSAKDGSSMLYIPASSSSSTYSTTAITPLLDVDSIKHCVLYFDAAASTSESNPGILSIYVVSGQDMTTNENWESWLVATFEIGGYRRYRACYVDLAQYTSAKNYKYIAFSASNTSVYIDNLVITNDRSAYIPVKDLKVTGKSSDYLAYSFTEIMSKDVTSWTVEYGLKGFTLGEGKQKVLTSTVDTLTDLPLNTTYDIYVKGNVAGATWTGPVSGSTLPTIPAKLPYITGFENTTDNNLWLFYNTKANGVPYANTFTIGNAANCGGSGDYALYLQSDGKYQYITKWWNDEAHSDYTVGTSYVYASRYISIDDATSYKISFKAKNPGNKKVGSEDDDFLAAVLVPSDAYTDGSSVRYADATTLSLTNDSPANGSYVIVGTTDATGKIYGVDEWITYSKVVSIQEPGIYQLLFRWYNPATGDYDVYYQGAAIDSVMIEEYMCTPVANINYTERKSTEVSFDWYGGKNKNYMVVVSPYSKLGNPALVDEAYVESREIITDGSHYTAKNLLPATEYTLYVKPICEGEETAWAKFIFSTSCDTQTTPFTQYFGEKPDCWYFTAGATNVGSHLQYDSNNKSTGEYITYLDLPATGYAVLPLLDIPVNKTDLKFGFHYGATTNASADVTIIVGVMANPWDQDSFEEIGRYTSTDRRNSSAMTYKYDNIEVLFNKYEGTGKYIALKGLGSGTIKTWISYVQVSELPNCLVPSQVEVLPSETTADVYWVSLGSETSWQLRLDGDSIITTTANPYHLTSLEFASTHTIEVRAVCGENEYSEFSRAITFTTDCGAYKANPWTEDFSGFNDVTSLTARLAQLTCWDNMMSEKSIDFVFAGQDKPQPTLRRLAVNYVWSPNWLSYLGNSQQLVSWDYRATSGRTVSNFKWFISPEIIVNNGNYLSFDMRYCTNQGDKTKEGSDRFFVAFSRDGGNTWKEADAVQFDLTQEDGQFHRRQIALGDNGIKVTDGDTIRFAFYHEGVSTSNALANSRYVVIDNVKINCTKDDEKDVYSCEGVDYRDGAFSVPAAKAIAGATYTYQNLVPQETGCDLLTTYNLHITPTYLDTIHALICEGETFECMGQELSTTGMHVMRGTSKYGCDSIVYVDLTVVSPIRKPIEMTVCEGETYDFHGTIVSQPGVYKYTVPSVLGCDSLYEELTFSINSIVHSPISAAICEGEVYELGAQRLTEAGFYQDTTYTEENGCMLITELTLTVNKPVQTTIEGILCAGHEYIFNDKTLTAAGTYYDTIPSLSTGCDSIIVLNLTERAKITTSIEVAICEGDEYEFGGETLTTAGEYTTTLPDALGCDSVINLTLTVNQIVNVTKTLEVNVAELPHEVDEFVTIPDGTEPGLFVVEILTDSAGCQLTRYEVTITDGTAVNNVEVGTLTIAPNPVLSGSVIAINYAFTSAQTAGMNVYVYDAVGTLVRTLQPTESPMLLNVDMPAGMYMLRITTGTGENLTGTFIVK